MVQLKNQLEIDLRAEHLQLSSHGYAVAMSLLQVTDLFRLKSTTNVFADQWAIRSFPCKIQPAWFAAPYDYGNS